MNYLHNQKHPLLLRETLLPFSMAKVLLYLDTAAKLIWPQKKMTDTVMTKPLDSLAKNPPSVTIAGSADAYYRFNFSNPKTNLMIIPELRLDNASKDFFVKSDGTNTKSTVGGLLAEVYHS